MGTNTPEAQSIINVCRAVWPSTKVACNLFVIDVARRLSVTLSGRADNIVDQIQGASWTQLADGPAAHDAAAQGKFVVAGLKTTEFGSPQTEGHVAVVVAGAMNAAGWAPAGYWGSTKPAIAEKGGNGKPISLCFKIEDSTKLHYACRTV